MMVAWAPSLNRSQSVGRRHVTQVTCNAFLILSKGAEHVLGPRHLWQEVVYCLKPNMATMRQIFVVPRLRGSLALEDHIARAGCAMACAYSSSDEFEAAVIQANLAARGYGWKRLRRYAMAAVAAIAGVV